MVDHTFKKDFEYSHDNPYHDKLGEFSEFVLRDSEGEQALGAWNKDIFKKENPLFVEIGSGYGHFMLDYCERNPNVNFIGMDFRFKRSFQLVKKLAKHPHKNFRYLRARGERLNFLFDQAEVDSLLYFFPDPWPKKKHWKKRLFQPLFLESAAKVIKPGGKFYIKTDHDGYYQWMKNVLREDSKFKLIFDTTDLHFEHSDHFLASFKTKFEKIFIEQNINIKAIVLERKSQ